MATFLSCENFFSKIQIDFNIDRATFIDNESFEDIKHKPIYFDRALSVFIKILEKSEPTSIPNIFKTSYLTNESYIRVLNSFKEKILKKQNSVHTEYYHSETGDDYITLGPSVLRINEIRSRAQTGETGATGGYRSGSWNDCWICPCGGGAFGTTRYDTAGSTGRVGYKGNNGWVGFYNSNNVQTHADFLLLKKGTTIYTNITNHGSFIRYREPNKELISVASLYSTENVYGLSSIPYDLADTEVHNNNQARAYGRTFYLKRPPEFVPKCMASNAGGAGGAGGAGQTTGGSGPWAGKTGSTGSNPLINMVVYG